LVAGLVLVLLAGPPVGEQLVTHARRFLGQPYVLGGRMHATKAAREGIDCMGLVFAAAEGVQRCSWRSFSYNPTTLLADETFGKAVPGVSPVATADLEVAKLAPGDVLMLVQSTENPNEPSIGKLGDQPVWVWHMGIYSGGGKWLVGDHFAGEVVEVELLPYLREHADAYDGMFALRPAKVAPPKCRLDARMPVPR
jgi:cell wall-associated NlpC family hydrolase